MNQVICDGGLANRLNTLLTALVLKKHTQTAWSIAWPVNNWCGAPFEDLFEPMLPVNQNGLRYFKRNQDRYWFLFHENQIGFDEGRITYNKSLPTLDALCDVVRQHRRLAYFHHAIPGFVDDEELRAVLPMLRPNERVRTTVNQLAHQYGITSETIGVHIRKTDFGATVDEDAIFEKIAGAPGHYFICSDAPDVLEKFSTLSNCACIPKPSLPKKLDPGGGWNSVITDADGRTYPFNVDRDREAVFWGWVDLLLLARTRVAATSGSSFLGLAHRLAKIGYAG